MTRRLFVLLCTASLFLSACERAPVHLSTSASAPQPQKLPFPVIDLRGDGAALGAAHGRQLGDSIRLLHDKYLAKWFASPSLKFAAQSVAVLFEAKLQEQHRQEIHALA